MSSRSPLGLILMTAIVPVLWGSTYVVTRQWLPADMPLTGAAIRALPAGLLLLAITRRLPEGQWWWRSTVLSDRKSTRLNSSHSGESRMPSSA